MSLFQVFVCLGHFIGRLPQLLGDIFLICGYLIGPFVEFRPMFPVMFQPVGQQTIELTPGIVHKILVPSHFRHDA